MKKLLLLLILLGFHTQSFALGTVAGTAISDNGNTLLINYYSPSGVAASPLSGSGILSTTVQAVYGFNLTTSLPSDQSVTKNSTAYYSYSFQNRSNTVNTTVYSETSFLNIGNFGTAWSRNFTTSGGSIGLDASQSTTYRVIVPANAGNNSKGVSNLSFSIGGSNFGTYSGFNGTSYGGVGSYSDIVTTSIVAPDIRVQAKTLKVILAPTANGYRGGDTNYGHDPVPGSVIEYSIQIVNDGSYTSTTTDVTEKIPANAYFLSIPSDSAVTESAHALNAFNDVDYDTSGDGIVDVNAPTNTYVGRQAVRNIRFRINAVGIGQTKILKYRVTIRN